MKLFISFLLLIVFYLGCSNSNDAATQDHSATSFTIKLAPILNEPLSIMSAFEFEFSDIIDPESINSQTVYLLDNTNNTPVEAELFSLDTKVRLTPLLYLKPNTSYTLVVTTDVRSSGGVSLTQEFTKTFTTIAEGEVPQDPLAYTFVVPPEQSIEVDPDTAIMVKFNRCIAPSVAQNQNIITLKDANGNTVSGSVEVFNNNLIFYPTALENNQTYTVELTAPTQIIDMYANPYEQNLTTWSFTTKVIDTDNVFGHFDFDGAFQRFASVAVSGTPREVHVLPGTGQTKQIVAVTEEGMAFYEITFDPDTNALSLSNRPIAQIQLSDILGGSAISASSGVGLSDGNLGIVLATAQNEIKTLKINLTNFSITSVSSQSVPQAVYKIKRLDENSTQFFAVGPRLGVYSITYSDPDFTIESIQEKIADDATKTYINIEKIDDGINGYYTVADYFRGVDRYDLNFGFVDTLITRGNSKFFMRELISGGPQINAVGTMGVTTSYDINGTHYGDDLKTFGKVKDILNFEMWSDNSSATAASMYIVPSKGFVYTFEGLTLGVRAPGVIGVDHIYSDVYKEEGYCIAYTQDGNITLYNSNPDLYPPYAFMLTSSTAGVTIAFYDEYIDRATIDSTKFTLSDANGANISFTYSQNNNTSYSYAVDLNASLTSGAVYTVTIDPSIKDRFGKQLDANTTQIQFIAP